MKRFILLFSLLLVVLSVGVGQASANRYIAGTIYNQVNGPCNYVACKLVVNIGSANYCLSPVSPGTNTAFCYSLPPGGTTVNVYARVDSGPSCYYFSGVRQVTSPYEGSSWSGSFTANQRACGGSRTAGPLPAASEQL